MNVVDDPAERNGISPSSEPPERPHWMSIATWATICASIPIPGMSRVEWMRHLIRAHASEGMPPAEPAAAPTRAPTGPVLIGQAVDEALATILSRVKAPRAETAKTAKRTGTSNRRGFRG